MAIGAEGGFASNQSSQAIPAPIGGWNQRDALDVMPQTDAVTFTNWFAAVGNVALRTGYTTHVTTGLGSGAVDTGAEFHVGATRKMLAAANGKIFDATTSAVSALASGFSENRWQWVIMDSKMGLVNGTDAPQQYDGSSISAMTLVDAASASGLTKTNVIGIIVHKGRSIFWEDGSQDFWYSSLNALGGAVTKFTLSRVGNFGGNIVCAGTWNVQGGDDTWGSGGIGTPLIVFVMSSGEAIVYSGDDPGVDFSLIGVYRIPPPLDIRGIEQIEGDLLILTRGGVVSMRTVVGNKIFDERSDLADKITKAVVDKATTVAGNTGWQMIYHGNYSLGELLLINVPNSTTDFEQYVMNLGAGVKPWAPWEDLDARAWWRYNDAIYFGTADGQIMKYDSGNSDNGTAISADCETAYNYFQARGLIKNVGAIRVVMASSGAITASVAAQFDFKKTAIPANQLSLAPPAFDWENLDELWEEWDTDWDAAVKNLVGQWAGAAGSGYAVGARVRVSTTDDLEWHSLTYAMGVGRGMF